MRINEKYRSLRKGSKKERNRQGRKMNEKK
jgi:hypothetical protein